jgi:hypothetical protein
MCVCLSVGAYACMYKYVCVCVRMRVLKGVCGCVFA